MYELYAVQAAAVPGEGKLAFEEEDGYTECLHLGQHDTAEAALQALADADAARATRPSYTDPTVRPPLWGHELYRTPAGGRSACVGRASAGAFTATAELAAAAPEGISIRAEQGASLPSRWQ